MGHDSLLAVFTEDPRSQGRAEGSEPKSQKTSGKDDKTASRANVESAKAVVLRKEQGGSFMSTLTRSTKLQSVGGWSPWCQGPQFPVESYPRTVAIDA